MLMFSHYIGNVGRWRAMPSGEEAYRQYRRGDMYLMYRAGYITVAFWATVADRNEFGDPIEYLQKHTNWKVKS